MADTIFQIKMTGVDDVLALLQNLPPELVSRRGGPVKSAARKAMKVVHARAVANLQAQTSNATTVGRQLSTGLLAANVIVSRGKPPADQNGERYLVRVKRKAYPGGGASTHATARWLEWGTATQPAEPWLVPAAIATAAQAIQTAERELVAGLDRIVRKYNKGRK